MVCAVCLTRCAEGVGKSTYQQAQIVKTPGLMSIRYRSDTKVSGARPTNNISIEFEIRSKFGVLYFKIYLTDHNDILHKSRQYNCRDVSKISVWSMGYILNQNTANFGRISNSIEISLIGTGAKSTSNRRQSKSLCYMGSFPWELCQPCYLWHKREDWCSPTWLPC